ncbi:response regulator transcription factor [Alphaproteobacteria bacterium]|nr:response regulator transcription factor [Alphaproteobacteria bacterium]
MRILLLEDDARLGPWLKKNLTDDGNITDLFSDGVRAELAIKKLNYEILIIDRMTPGIDGLSLVKKIRSEGNNIPVIFLTALNEIENRLEGFEAGADDYLAKPFSFDELISRINAISKRSINKKRLNIETIKSGDIELDLIKRICFRQKKKIDLNNKELTLMEYFIRFEGKRVTKAMLLELVWNINFDPTTSIIETHISRLRSKIEKPFQDRLIKTVRGSGYVYTPKKNI